MMNISLRRSLFYSTAIAAMTLAGAHGAKAAVLGGGSTLAALDYLNEFSDSGIAGFTYCSVGSGAGTSAFINNLVAPLEADTTRCPASVVTGHNVDYGASDAFISSSNVSLFNASANAGPMIQLPMLGTPVTMALSTHLGNKTLTNDGQETLTDAQLCGIYSGVITSWHTIDSTITSGTITVAYRSDSSGTSFLLTNHLKAVCPVSTATAPGFTSAQLSAMPTTTFAASLFGGTPPANFTGGTGSSGVEAHVAGTSNVIGYLSPDYTHISANGANAGDPFVASVVNNNNTSTYLPTIANTSTALGTVTAPSGAAETNAINWAPVAANPATGYPISGYTYWFLPTCFTSSTNTTKVVDFLEDHLNVSGSNTVQIDDIASNGFMPPPGVTDSAAPAAGSYAAKIVAVFLTGDAEHLNIATIGASGGNATQCTSAAGR